MQSAKPLNPDLLIAVEIGGTKLQILLGTPAGTILDRRRFAVDKKLGAAGIRANILLAIKEFQQIASPCAIGVGFGGPFNRASGIATKSFHIDGWDGFPLRSWLEQETGLPAFIDNDANVASLGEALLGAGRKKNPSFYVTMGSGVGGGLVVDGKIYHGTNPGEAEIGHLRMDRKGSIVEDFCSGWAIDKKIREIAKTEPSSTLAQMVAGMGAGEAKMLIPALEADCSAARAIFEETAQNIAFAYSYATHLFSPEIIIMGGGVSLIGEPLRAAVSFYLPDFLMVSMFPGPEIKLAELGEDAVPCGALLLPASEGFSCSQKNPH